MTELGLCHNANFPETRLTAAAVDRYRPQHARTITYWSEDLGFYRGTLESCRELARLGVTNLVVFNTEAYAGALRNTELMAERLHAFLKLAQDEYGSPVHAIEPLNEIDTPNWDDGEGGPLTAELILEYTYRAHSIAMDMFGVETLGPSFLGGPSSELPRAVLGALAADGRIQTASFHMYGRSVGGQPSARWLFGTVEEGIAELERYIGKMRIDLTEGGCWTLLDGLGEEAQRRFVEALCAFQHPRVRRNYLFAYNDACCSTAEREQGKDFGLEDDTGRLKLAALAFRGGL
jgi:hypothetical protein